MLKGCECYEEIPDRSLPYQNPVDYQAVGNWFKNIKPAEKPVCTKQDSRFSETYAPQKKKDGANSVEEKAEEFCSKMDGKTVVQAPDGIDTEFSYTELSKAAGAMWLSASIRYNSPSEKCGKSAKISKRDCINSLTKAMTTCEPNSAKTHGAALASGCIFYNITMDMSTDPNSPPWNRKARTSCDLKDVSDIQNNFLTGLYPSFCDAIKKDPTQALERTFTNTDFKNPSKRSHILNKRTPPVNNNNYPGYKFNFKWTGGDNCRMDCTEAYSSMLKDTCAQSNLVTTKASRDAGCGIYSWEVIHPPPVTCEKNKANPFAIEASKTECKWEDNCLARPQSYPKSAFLAAAHQMCYGGYDWTAKPTGKDDMAIWWQTGNYFWFDTKNIDPDTNLPAHCGGSSIGDINQWSPDSRKYCKSGPGFKNSDSKIFLTITPSKDQEGCEKLQDYNLPTKGDCEKIFASVADTCITDPNDKEQTGGFYHEKASTGCWDWWIWGIHLT
ncbi:hypothetical protein GQ43DRAFT_383812 [Delitschia confertaspora ATCC 74209]|uniref:Uncharacterized protein n=1 Tax=Delitschia confertaspora ATCC 74209 TaxID=1513339 RepID=A0A9P4MTK7_9PLEO|nr:hypothetical protein GQ43DRAFT_383812 [Delitschia confertaspora ATCC 74209]